MVNKQSIKAEWTPILDDLHSSSNFTISCNNKYCVPLIKAAGLLHVHIDLFDLFISYCLNHAIATTDSKQNLILEHTQQRKWKIFKRQKIQSTQSWLLQCKESGCWPRGHHYLTWNITSLPYLCECDHHQWWLTVK